MRFIVADLKRALGEKRLYLALALGIGIALGSGWIVVYRGTADGYGFFTQSQSLVLPFIMPLLCAMPYSDMQMREQACKFDRFMSLRLGQKSWVFRRFWVNGVVSGLTALLPGLSLLAVSTCFDLGACTMDVYQVLGLNFGFGFAFGTLSYGLCFVNTQSYIPLVAPQVVYLFLVYAFPIVGLDRYFPPLAYAPWILPSIFSYTHMGVLLLVVTGCGVVLSCIGAVKKAVGQ